MVSVLILTSITLPWIGAILVWAVGNNRPTLQHGIAVGFSLASGFMSASLFLYPSNEMALSIPIGGAFGNFTFVPDGLGVVLAAIAALIGSLAVIFSVDYMRGDRQLGRYYSMVLLFIGSMVGLVLTSNLLLMFVFWEMTALCSYALISFYNDDPKAVTGGIKALIMTQIGGIGLLFGALIAFSSFGSYDISIFLQKANTLPPALLSLTAFSFLVAAAAKSAQFPFQTWLPDAMEAPTPVSALIHAATMVNAGVYLLARFYPAFANVPGWTTAVVWVGVLSALLSAGMALVASDLKRVLAYSTVSQLGYMVYAIGVGGIFASQFHLLSHAVFKALLFLAAGAVIHSVGTRNMNDMGGLGKQMPFVRNVFLIGSLALAGLPFLNGFWSKELILEEGLAHGPLWAFIGMMMGAGLTACYTLKCVWMVFYGDQRTPLHGHDAGHFMKIALFILSIGALTSWVLVGPLGTLMELTLPFHSIKAHSTGEILIEVLTAPATLLALLVIASGFALWVWRNQLSRITDLMTGIAEGARRSFGFEEINTAIVKGTNSIAEFIRNTQTGILSVNILGILVGLVVLLVSIAVLSILGA